MDGQPFFLEVPGLLAMLHHDALAGNPSTGSHSGRTTTKPSANLCSELDPTDAFPRHRSEARVPIGVIIDSPTSGVLSLADRGLRTTRFETFEILWRSNRESYRKEKEIAGSGRDLQVLAHRPAFELRPL
jgi:hypothetical protein